MQAARFSGPSPDASNLLSFPWKRQLRSVHPLFADFPVLAKPVWNNTKQTTPGGGNAFWETGPARPDLILEDLRAIFDGSPVPGFYYLPVR